MNICFDTEFTDLLRPELISIGFVSEDDSELYIELLDWSPRVCSLFVREVVIPLLGPVEDQMTEVDAAAAIVSYINAFREPVTLMSDAAIDIRLLGKLLHDGGQQQPTSLSDLLVISPSIEGEIVREGLYTEGLRRHHALDDARALLAAWRHG